jgi:hypothetical protein
VLYVLVCTGKLLPPLSRCCGEGTGGLPSGAGSWLGLFSGQHLALVRHWSALGNYSRHLPVAGNEAWEAFRPVLAPGSDSSPDILRPTLSTCKALECTGKLLPPPASCREGGVGGLPPGTGSWLGLSFGLPGQDLGLRT